MTLNGFLSVSDLALAPDEQHVYFGGFPVGVGGARLVPEPAVAALAATAIGALLGLRRSANRQGHGAAR